MGTEVFDKNPNELIDRYPYQLRSGYGSITPHRNGENTTLRVDTMKSPNYLTKGLNWGLNAVMDKDGEATGEIEMCLDLSFHIDRFGNLTALDGVRRAVIIKLDANAQGDDVYQIEKVASLEADQSENTASQHIDDGEMQRALESGSNLLSYLSQENSDLNILSPDQFNLPTEIKMALKGISSLLSVQALKKERARA